MRILDWILIPVLLVVFAGLGWYHFVRTDHTQHNAERVKELTRQSLDVERPSLSDWPQWRGPNRDGVSAETILTDWPSAGPRVLWQQKVGDGYSSMAIANGRVFTMFQDGDHETLGCWDAETGQEHWRFRYPAHYKNSYGNGPRATPTIDGDHVYLVGGTGIMHCLDVSGTEPRVVWKKDLMAEFNAEAPKWGVSFSPLVDDTRVYIQPGGAGGNSLAALDKKTGALVWKGFDDAASYSSPMPATFAGQRQVLFFTGERLVGVVPDTGALLWEFAWPIEYNCNIATPIVMKDYVFISSGYGRGCAMLKIEKEGDAWTPNLVYKNRVLRNHHSTSVRHKNHIYGFDDSTFKCIELATGKKAWSERSFDKGSVLLVGDHLIIQSETGEIVLAEANPEELREKARFQFSQQASACWSVPVVVNGRLYVRDKTKLVCYDVKAAR